MQPQVLAKELVDSAAFARTVVVFLVRKMHVFYARLRAIEVIHTLNKWIFMHGDRACPVVADRNDQLGSWCSKRCDLQGRTTD